MAELSTHGGVIKVAYEGEADTNAFTDAEQAKLASIEAGADVTDGTNVNAAGAVMESDYNTSTILVADTDNTPTPLTVAASTFVGRKASGGISAVTAAEARTILNVASGAIANVVEDTTPQLGGNLDVNSRSIVSTSNGNITLSPNGTGAVVIGPNRMPTNTGSSGQFLRTDGAGVATWATVSGGGGGTSATLIYPYIFEASDNTGATDVTSELETLLATANGSPVFIPEGTYLINSLAVSVSIDLHLSSNATIVFDYATDNRAIWQRNESDATLAQTISAITDVVWFHGELVTRLTVGDVTGYARHDVVHIHSQDGWLGGGTDNRRLGQSSKVAEVDTVNNYLYLYTRLELGALMTSTPRVRKYTDRTVSINGGVWTANGQWDDAELSVQANRRAAIEVYATPRVHIKNATFRKTWAQAIILKNCPFSIVENCKFEKLPNLFCPGGSAGTGTVLTITGITNANPGVVTVAAATGLANGDKIFIYDVGGMTEVNNRAYHVKNLSGTTFQLEEWWGDGDVTSAVNTTSYGTYTSGGSVSEGDVNGLGYGVQVYGSSCFTVIQNCVFEECRHCVTSDAIQDATYNDSEWATYGFPTNVFVKDCVSFNAHGIPFDTHEEGVNWRFINCHVVYAGRGPEFQDSYYGVGFQDRATNTSYINCSVYGGAWGLRISSSDPPMASTTRVQNCSFENLRSIASEDGYAIRFLPEVAVRSYDVKLIIDNLTVKSSQTGIQMDNGANAIVVASNLKMYDVDEALDIGGGNEFKCVDRVTIDYRENTFAASHYVARMRSHATYGGSTLLFLGGLTILGDTGHMPSEVFYQSDTTATKYYYMPTNGLVQDYGGASAASLLSGGATTFTAYSTISVT